MTSKICGNCSIEKQTTEYRKIKEKRTKNITEYLCSMCKKCEKDKALSKYYENREENISKNKKYKQENKEKVNETRRKYMKKLMENPEEKIKRNMKSLISSKLRNSKSRHTSDYLGKGMKDIISWIEYNMEQDMTWENYGSYWEIDHSLPISLFDVLKENEMILCFCWMNLMPMLKFENNRKSNKIDIQRIEYQKERLKKYIEQLPVFEEEVVEFIKLYDSKVKTLLKD
jgi:hypothetical protein